MMNILQEVVNDGTGSRAKLTNCKRPEKQVLPKDLFSLGRIFRKNLLLGLWVLLPVMIEITILVMLDEPKGDYYGGTVAALLGFFSEIASKILPYLSIPLNKDY